MCWCTYDLPPNHGSLVIATIQVAWTSRCYFAVHKISGLYLSGASTEHSSVYNTGINESGESESGSGHARHIHTHDDPI